MAVKNGSTKNQVKEITDRLEQGVKDLFTGEKYLSYLQTMSRFHRYSTRNTLLIYMQKPDAMLVAGYQAWQSKFGRYVKKGETGIKILAPTPFTITKEQQKLDPDSRRPILSADGLPITEEVEVRIARFKVIPVFDVSQTDGKPLPSLVEDLTGNVKHYELFLDALLAVSPLPVRFEPLEPGTDGVCRMGDSIAIRSGMSEIQTISAVVHEITHARLHDLEHLQQEDETAKPKDRRTEEVEAESVSYAVCQHYGIETAANSFGYLAAWSKTRELKELNASLDIIRKTAAELIDSVDENFWTLAKERGIDLSPKKQDEPAPEPLPEPDATVSGREPSSVAEPELKPNQHIEEIGGVEYIVTGAAPLRTPKPDKQYELSYGHMGNGLTVWNHLEEKDGDYVTVAHIAPDRKVTFYDKDMPDEIKAKIEETARTTEMSVSATQDAPVFSVPPIAVTPEQDLKPEALPQAQETPDEPETDNLFPDPAIGLSERDLYGYKDPSMLPLLKDRALELYDADHTIYMLYPDNTEAMVFERDEIAGHDGIFGIEAGEWEASREYAQIKAAAHNSEASKEAELIYGKESTYGIYQLKSGEETRNYRFKSLANLESQGLSVNRANYELVYTAPLIIRDKLTNLHKIYETFNIDHPADFSGHSLSVSDIIVLQWRGEITSHYVDSYGFKELPAFLGNEKQAELDPATELAAYEKPKEPEPAAPTVSELDEQVKAGKQISLLDLARAVKNEQKQPGRTEKPSILAKLQEGKKAVSQGTDTQKTMPKRDGEREV